MHRLKNKKGVIWQTNCLDCGFHFTISEDGGFYTMNFAAMIVEKVKAFLFFVPNVFLPLLNVLKF